MDWGTSPGAEAVAREVVDSAFVIGREVGAGLLESVYKAGLADELRQRGLFVEQEVPVPCVVRGRAIPVAHPRRADADLPAALEVQDRAPHQLQLAPPQGIRRFLA